MVGTIGAIPREIGLLNEIEILHIGTNNLSGNIPVSVGNMTGLMGILLNDNQLEGSIPGTIGNLSRLQGILFQNNRLTGSIPETIGKLSSLQGILLHNNRLTGSIPGTIGKLSSLEGIIFSDNWLTGSIPSSLFNISSLIRLAAANNSLEGNLPADMFDTLPNIKQVLLFNNRLHGMLPPSLTNASNLQLFEISNCFFSGTVPSNLGNLPSLFSMSLSNNRLEASTSSDWDFLPSLTNCTNLQNLDLDGNKFGGSLPTSITNVTSSLQSLSFSGNHINGVIPSGLGNLLHLTALDMSYNQLSGVIPDTIGGLSNLNVLELLGNKISGQIPYSIGNLTKLYLLLLQNNNITGSIPESIGNCKSLQVLDVSQNKITGAVPRDLLILPSMSVKHNLSDNLFNGSLPMEVGNLRALNTFDVSYNNLSGEILGTLASCLSLEFLYLQHNNLHGTIPPALIDLKGLRKLDVSHNNLSGRISEFLATMDDLQNLNLSFNEFEGEVPGYGIFNNTGTIDLQGNKKLCGGSPAFHLRLCYIQPERNHHLFPIKVVVPILSGALILVIALIIYISLYRMKKLKQNYSPAYGIADKFVRVSYGELIRATDGFSTSNLIGKGSFGSVYKGILSGTAVAVKVLDLQSHGASKSFMAECEILRSTRHRNLVQIITACSSIDSTGNDFKALVLKYMSNGNLENLLHQTSPETSATKSLNLIQRLNIAMDVALALDYLHGLGPVPIVHCDVKPSNVLLDEDMTAHLRDFGIARFLREKTSMMSDNYSESLAIRGTIGYVAPEYGMGGQLSTIGDVYSYGILLLEMFTGKKATDDMFKDGESLRNYVKMTPPTHVRNIVDQRMLLMQDDNEAQLSVEDVNKYMATVLESTISIFRIGLVCSKEDPRDRMTMPDAINQLHKIRNMVFN